MICLHAIMTGSKLCKVLPMLPFAEPGKIGSNGSDTFSVRMKYDTG